LKIIDFQVSDYINLVGSPSFAMQMRRFSQHAHLAHSNAAVGELFSAERCASRTSFVPLAASSGKNAAQSWFERWPYGEPMRVFSHAG
jgi:hypothetical protein